MAIVEQEGGAVLETPEIAALIRVRDAYQSGEIRWIRGSLEDGSGGYCLRGAVHNWLGFKSIRTVTTVNNIIRVSHLMDDHFASKCTTVEGWNDCIPWEAPTDAVVRKIDEIIAELREGEQACRS